MSDQDEISRLLAEAAAQAEAETARSENSTTSTGEANPDAPAPSTVRKAPSRSDKRNNDVLGLAWFNDSLHAASFHRQKMTVDWSASTPIRTVADFEAVIDDAIALTGFSGTETLLLLENEQFMHQADDIPVFSDKVLRSYLKNRVLRHEQTNGKVLWVMQPLITMKQEQSILLHLLPRSFYDDLNRVLLKRHLDLTRILPLVVPLQYELNRIPSAKNATVILAAEVGHKTAVIAGRIGGPLLFSRTTLADMNREPDRVGVEINRSLLYTKQHFESAASSIWLMAENGSYAVKAITAKCGGHKIVAVPASPIDWLQTAAKIPPKQPINLLSRYLKTKQRNQFIRTGTLVAVWLGLALMITSLWHTANEWNVEKSRLSALRERAPVLQAERERLFRRNQAIERDRLFADRVNAERLPPVPARLLALVASLLPEPARLIEFNVRWDTESLAWSFQLTGSIDSDDETARALITGMQDELARSPLRIRFNENARVLAAAPLATPGAPELQRFTMEGVLLEK